MRALPVAGASSRAGLAMRGRRRHRGNDHQVEYAQLGPLPRQVAAHQEDRARLRRGPVPAEAALHLRLIGMTHYHVSRELELSILILILFFSRENVKIIHFSETAC